jgi:hypothetical protein
MWTAQDASGCSSVVTGGGVQASVRGEITGDKVRFRSGPGTNSNIITEFYRGEVVEVSQRYASGRETHYWFKAVHNGRYGWVYGEFIRIPQLPSKETAVPSSVAVPQPQAADRTPSPASQVQGSKKTRSEQLV